MVKSRILHVQYVTMGNDNKNYYEQLDINDRKYDKNWYNS